MARSWFVTPDTIRLSLPEGQWIEVKKRLTAGESRKAMSSLIHEVRTDGRITPNLEMVGKAEVLAYLVDWSLEDGNGKRVNIDTPARMLAALDGLDEDKFQVISTAIGDHVKAMEVEREAEKNAQATPTA